MKSVLDTNVFISGIFWSGYSERILYSWFKNKFELIISSEIVEEIIKTLINFRVPLSINELLLWISILIWKSTFVEPIEKITAIKEDPDDNKFLEAAVSGNAEYIVSQDNHLLKLISYKDIKIINPEEFSKILN